MRTLIGTSSGSRVSELQLTVSRPEEPPSVAASLANVAERFGGNVVVRCWLRLSLLWLFSLFIVWVKCPPNAGEWTTHCPNNEIGNKGATGDRVYQVPPLFTSNGFVELLMCTVFFLLLISTTSRLVNNTTMMKHNGCAFNHYTASWPKYLPHHTSHLSQLTVMSRCSLAPRNGEEGLAVVSL